MLPWLLTDRSQSFVSFPQHQDHLCSGIWKQERKKPFLKNASYLSSALLYFRNLPYLPTLFKRDFPLKTSLIWEPVILPSKKKYIYEILYENFTIGKLISVTDGTFCVYYSTNIYIFYKKLETPELSRKCTISWYLVSIIDVS